MTSHPEEQPTRLNKFLAYHCGISRREADDYIAAGRVHLNGEVATIGDRVRVNDTVVLDNKPLKLRDSTTTIALHKPIDYVCSRKRQGDTPTIYELLPPEFHRLKPVGRLDKLSSGIILLTDDGDLAHQMTHPKFAKIKRYRVSLDIPLQPLHRQMIQDYGVTLDDGVSKFAVNRLEDNAGDAEWEVILREGRNRQIRRTFAALGYTVTALHRVQFGDYTVDDIEPGKWRTLS